MDNNVYLHFWKIKMKKIMGDQLLLIIGLDIYINIVVALIILFKVFHNFIQDLDQLIIQVIIYH